jgi:hypothetical protein
MTRFEELEEYRLRAGLTGAVLVSLPYPGWVNFNREVLQAKMRKPEVYRALAAFDFVYKIGEGKEWAPPQQGSRLEKPKPLAVQVREFAEIGFDGLKVWAGKPAFQKLLGMAPDGEEFSGAFKAAADEGMPVLLHAGDPPDFWTKRAAGWKPFTEYISQAARVAAEHPRTRFVFPHMLFLARDLGSLADFLDAHPNAFLDVAPGNYFYAPLSERREEAARFFGNYAGRILFGTDGLFFPKTFRLFDYMDAGRVYRRFKNLYDFFFMASTVDNPYPYTMKEIPEVTGPVLEAEAARELACGACERLFFDGESRRINREKAFHYINTFPRGAGEAGGTGRSRLYG